jgi:isocitrate dehydrogenase
VVGTHEGRQGRGSRQHRTKSALSTGRVLIKDAIADITLQQVLTRPDEFE